MTTTTTTTTASHLVNSITAHVEQAQKNVNAARTEVARIATTWSFAKDLNRQVLRMAAAEGELIVWTTLQNVAGNLASRDQEFTAAIANEVVMGLLTNGADDEWSGRGNDAARAGFDGIRSAAQKVQYLPL